MIRAGAGLVEELQLAVLPVRPLNDHALEVVEVHQARTGVGRKQAAGLHQRDRQLIQVLVLVAAVGGRAIVPRVASPA